MSNHGDTNDRYEYDPESDEFRRTAFTRPPAPDVDDTGRRTDHVSAADEKAHLEGWLRTLEVARSSVAEAPERESNIALLEEEIWELDERIPDVRESLKIARGHLRSIDFHAPDAARRHGFPAERVVIGVLATVEASLSYLAFRVAAPNLSGSTHEPLLALLSRHGPELAAAGIGVMLAYAQVLIGRELARASRGVMTDPKEIQ